MKRLRCCCVLVGLVVLLVAGCKDSAQKGFPAGAPVTAPPVDAVAIDAAPADPATLDRTMAGCVAAAAVRDIGKLGLDLIGAKVVDAWLLAPPDTAAAALAALAEGAAVLGTSDHAAALLAEVGRGYLQLDRRAEARDAFTRALAIVPSPPPVVPVALDAARRDAVEGLAALGVTAEAERALAAFPETRARAAVGFARAGDQPRAAALVEKMRTGKLNIDARVSLALALVLTGRDAAARAIWADAKPRDAAVVAVGLAARVAVLARGSAATYIDDAETAVSRANDLREDERVLLGLRLAELRQQTGDTAGAAKRRAGLARQAAVLEPAQQATVRPRVAEVALAAGDLATADAELAWAAADDSLARLGMLMVRVQREVVRGNFVAASEPLFSEALAPLHLGYATIYAGYRKAGKLDAAVEDVLVQRACPRN